MGYSIGDFSAVSTTEVYSPSALRAVIRQFGEFQVKDLGTRYLFASYPDEVTALVRTAGRVMLTDDVDDIPILLREHWLPTRVGDKRTSFIIAEALNRCLEGRGLSLPLKELRAHVFIKPYDLFEQIKTVLFTDDEVKSLDGLFKPYTDKQSFKAKFNNGDTGVLKLLGLEWKKPSINDLEFGTIPKIKFPELAEFWIRKRATLQKFFSCGAGTAEKSTACGSLAQIASVECSNGITKIRSLCDLSANDYSLLSCFPATCILSSKVERNVVLTTPIPVKVRAIEFMQLDWN
jgi:hypothetical protein